MVIPERKFKLSELFLNILALCAHKACLVVERADANINQKIVLSEGRKQQQQNAVKTHTSHFIVKGSRVQI